MNRIKSLIGTLMAAAALAVVMTFVFIPVASLTGCASGQVVGDPFVVEAEKDLRTAFNVVDEFLLWEANNRAIAGKDVTAAADAIRTTFPAAYKAAWDTLSTYKQNRDPTGRANLTTWLETINSAMLNAIRAMPQAQAAKAMERSSSTRIR